MLKGKWTDRNSRYAEMVKALYHQGYRTDEIAKKLNISENSVVLILEDAKLI